MFWTVRVLVVFDLVKCLLVRTEQGKNLISYIVRSGTQSLAIRVIKIPDLRLHVQYVSRLHPYSEFVSSLWIPINENSLGLSLIELLIEDDTIFGRLSL
jgi:hypothetical protein